MRIAGLIMVAVAISSTAFAQEPAAQDGAVKTTPPRDDVLERAFSRGPALGALNVRRRPVPSESSAQAADSPGRKAASSTSTSTSSCNEQAPAVEVTAGEDEQRAVLRACFDARLKGFGIDLVAKLSTPWQSDQDNVLADLDGLANATRVDLETAWSFTRGGARPLEWLGAIQLSRGVQEFDVLALDLSETNVSRQVWSGGLSLGFLRKREKPESGKAEIGYAALLQFRRESVYLHDPQEEVSVCVPVVTPAERCKQGFLSGPQAVDRSIVAAELRFVHWDFGFNPKASYELEDDVLGIELPIYLAQANGTLNGGVKFGWRDDTDDFTAAVFIGVPLKLGL
jgi:hypothetical protein